MKRLKLSDVLHAKNELLEKLGYVDDLVILMNYSTFEMLVCPPTKTQGNRIKTMFGMKLIFNPLIEDEAFYIITKEEAEQKLKEIENAN